MRHAGSLLLSLFLAPLIWVGTSYGLNEIGRTRAEFAGGFKIEIVLGLAALIAAGALYALLVMARLSPIGPALIGVVFLSLSTWAAFDPSSYFDTMPTDLRDNDFALTYPALGYSALLAVPLLATLLSPRRWRQYAHPSGAPAAPPYAMPAAGMPPPPVPAGAPYAQPYGGQQPSFAATPGYLTPPPPSGPPAPTSAPPIPSSPAAPAAPPTQRIPAQPAPPREEEKTTTYLSQPPAEGPTTRIPTSPTTAPPAVVAPAPPADQTTTRIGAQDTEATQLLKGPPPKDAYPRPAWSAPTPPPITPPGARKPDDDLDDPEATQPSR